MKYSLPPFLQERSFALSPFSEDAEQHTRQWLKSLGLEATSHAAHQLDIYMPGKYAGFMWPNATRETLGILSDLTGWFSCQDDLADEDLSRVPEALENAIREVYSAASDTSGKPYGALAAGLADIIGRAGANMPVQWMQRVVEQYGSYLYPCVCAAMHRRQGTQPPVQDYESVWRNAGGFQVCLEFTYFASGVHLPSSLYYSAVWQELRLLTLNLLKAVNDLLSFSIMEDPNEDVYNLLTHLRHHQQYSPDEAAAAVCCRIKEWAERFLEIQARLPDELERFNCDGVLYEQVVRCAEAFRLQWLGNIGWHLTAPRYQEIRFSNS
ncbi:terpene synthase family protein [Pseudomonas sp. Hz4]